MVDNQRRTLLKSLGVTATVGLSGCTQLLRDDTQNEPETSPTPEPTPNRTETPRNNNETDTPTDNNTDTETPEPDTPDSYRADRKRQANTDAEIEDLGNYSTEHEWDDIVTNTEEIQEMHREWTQQEAYGPLVNRIMSGEDFDSRGKIYPNWEGEDRGFFDQDAVRNEDDFDTIIRWYLPAIKEHDRENYGNAPSSRNHRFAATLETLINDHHPDEETQATFVKALPRHGIFGIQDENDEEFYLVDTTAASQYKNAVGRIGEFMTSEFDPSRELSRQNLWDPFHRFQPGETESIGYPSKSQRSIEALLALSVTQRQGDSIRQMYITDEWLDDAYQALRNGGSMDPITGPIEEIQDNAPQLQGNQYIGIYGNLDDTRIAVNSNDEIYRKVIGDPEPQGIDDIETMLETA